MNAIILNDKYQYHEDNILGRGGFGLVFKGQTLNSNQEIAIKVDKKIKYLNKEMKIYDIISDSEIMAKKIDYFEENNVAYLVMPLYYKSAEEIFRSDKKNYFMLKDVLMLGIQMFQQLHFLHGKGIIHLDIKPENMMYNNENNKFLLIDFGLTKNFLKDKKHICFKTNSGRCGTLKFMSINCHQKNTLSRKDDLISLSYALIYLYINRLPWKTHKYRNGNKESNYKKIMMEKLDFEENISSYNIPPPLLFLFNYSNNLQFKEDPDYHFLIKGFYNYLKINNYKYDGKWSWLNKI